MPFLWTSSIISNTVTTTYCMTALRASRQHENRRPEIGVRPDPVNPRSGCQHKAWGGAKRNPRNPSLKIFKARGAGDSRKSQPLSPASRAQLLLVALILGLTPQAVC
jgi:hypothetical protein